MLRVRRWLPSGLAVALARLLAVTPAGGASAKLTPLNGVSSARDIAGPVAPSARRTELAMRRNAERSLGAKRTPKTARTKEQAS